MAPASPQSEAPGPAAAGRSQHLWLPQLSKVAESCHSLTILRVHNHSLAPSKVLSQPDLSESAQPQLSSVESVVHSHTQRRMRRATCGTKSHALHQNSELQRMAPPFPNRQRLLERDQRLGCRQSSALPFLTRVGLGESLSLT